MSAERLLIRDLAPLGDYAGPRDVLLVDGLVAATDADAVAQGATARTLDGRGLTAAPGFVELQVNGVAGHDFTSEPAAMWDPDVHATLAAGGVTAFLPTVVTAPRGAVDEALRVWAAGRPRAGASAPLGLHVEGPYLADGRHGAHDQALLRDPDRDEVARWLAGGGLRVLTLAPELPGALDVIRAVVAAGAVASLGHTDADAATTRIAIDAGARWATHLFNAMSPLTHREPGATGALLDDERVALGLIADGVHLDPSVLRLVARRAPGRVTLVGDAIAALGMGDGAHRLGGRIVAVRGDRAALDDGTLAGSVAPLDACVRAFAEATGSWSEAIAAVTAAPARLLGRQAERGSLRSGSAGDVVLLDRHGRPRTTIIAGRVAWSAEASVGLDQPNANGS
jgi:N-acetylglucosamine-6-phosphate deacetylase